MNRTEIVVITEVKDRTSEGKNLYQVSYKGGFDGVLAEFSPVPQVGQSWKIISEFNHLISAELVG